MWVSLAVQICLWHKAICPLQPTSDRAGSLSDVLQCACVCTSDEHSEEAVQRLCASIDAKITRGRKQLECLAADARGPFGLGQCRGLLTRRQAAGISIGGQDGQAVGRRLGSGPADARGSFGLGQRRGLLARRQQVDLKVGLALRIQRRGSHREHQHRNSYESPNSIKQQAWKCRQCYRR